MLACDPYGLMAALGLQGSRSFPMTADCPACKAKGKLEVRSPSYAVCSSCWFMGDLTQLYMVKHKVTSEQAIQQLMDKQLIALDNPILYKAALEESARAYTVLKEWSKPWLDAVPGSANAVLDRLGLRVSPSTTDKLFPHVFITTRDQYTDAFEVDKEAKSVLQWWGRYAALGIPCYSGALYVGSWLITVNGANYLPRSVGNGIGMALGARTHQRVAVVDDPEFALRHRVWNATMGSDDIYAVIPAPTPSHSGDILDYVRGRQTVYVPTDAGGAVTVFRALATNQACLSPGLLKGVPVGKEYPCKGMFGKWGEVIEANACPPAKAMADYLVSLSVDDARAALTGLALSSQVEAEIMAYADEDGHQHLTRILKNDASAKTTIINGAMIHETGQGWTCNNKTISSATFKIEEVRPLGRTGNAHVRGTITYNRKTYQFQCELNEMRKSYGRWLESQVLINTGQLPQIDKAWSARLYDIAQAFHAPRAVLEQSRYGWDGQVLKMPYFTVDKTNVLTGRSNVTGPLMPYPQALSVVEWDSFKSADFCRTYLVLLGNMLRTVQGEPGRHMVYTKDPMAATRIAGALGDRVERQVHEILSTSSTLEPLPRCVEWVGDAFTKFVSTEGRVATCSYLDEGTARLLQLSGNWVALDSGTATDLIVLRHLFVSLSHCLRQPLPLVGDSDFYRKVVDLILPSIAAGCAGNKLISASLWLDGVLGIPYHKRVTDYLAWLVHHKKITPVVGEGEVFFSEEALAKAFCTPRYGVDIREMTNQLVEVRQVIPRGGGWAVAQDYWDFLVSMASTA